MERSAWLEERRRGIGGSDVAAILGMSKWKSPLQVYLDKIGEAEETPDNESMLWGRVLEPVIRQQYADRTGRPVRVPEKMIYHRKHEFMLANLDGFTDDGRVVEIKTARFGDEWGDPGTDQVPVPYLLQVQHYMAVTGFEVADVAVLIGGSDFRLYEIQADKDLHALLIGKEAEFWGMVQDRRAPEPVTAADAQAMFKAQAGLSVEANMDAFEAIGQLAEIRAKIKDFEQQEEQAKAVIMKTMGAADTLTWNGKTLATWKDSRPRQTFDTKSFQEAHPELYAQFVKNGNPSRRFILK